MQLLITGGVGFIGSYLCDRMIAKGHQVLCVDNLITGSLDNIASHAKNPRFKLIQHDVSKPFVPEDRVEYVLHFASPASPPDYLRYPIQTMKVGSLGTLNALGIAKAQKAKFLLASTSEVYGDPQVHPQPESYWGHVNSVGPRGVYDEAKRFAEALTMAYHREHGVDTRIIRIFNTYGPRMRKEDGRAIPNFIHQALQGAPLTVYGDGSQTRSFCYVEDLVAGIERMMEADYHEPVNLGNDHEYTLVDLARLIIRLSGSRSTLSFKPLPTDDPKVRRPDLARARQLLKWEAKLPLEEGLRRTIDWFRARP